MRANMTAVQVVHPLGYVIEERHFEHDIYVNGIVLKNILNI